MSAHPSRATARRLARCAAVAAAVAVAGQASAFVWVHRTDTIPGIESCQAALPVYDQALRSRPLAIQNDGDSGAFVTCGIEGSTGNVPSRYEAGVILRNDSGVEVDVECTLADARHGIDNRTFWISSATLPAGSADQRIRFRTAPEPTILFTYPSISCLLPPGVGISAIWHEYGESVGE